MAEPRDKRAQPPAPDRGPRSRPRSRVLPLLLAGALLAAVLAAVLITRGGDGEEGGTEAAATLSCEPAPGEGGEVDCPAEILTDPADIVVETNLGEFTIALDTEASPATTTSFRHLAEQGFYDGLDFHRVVPGFVIQGGDPNGDGSGGPGYFVDEDVPTEITYDQGTVAMAKTGADPAGRSGSQFFVVSGEDAELPPEYAYVGRVTRGLETVTEIESLGRGDGPPRRPVTIESMSVEPAG